VGGALFWGVPETVLRKLLREVERAARAWEEWERARPLGEGEEERLRRALERYAALKWKPRTPQGRLSAYYSLLLIAELEASGAHPSLRGLAAWLVKERRKRGVPVSLHQAYQHVRWLSEAGFLYVWRDRSGWHVGLTEGGVEVLRLLFTEPVEPPRKNEKAGKGKNEKMKGEALE
jgi:hypothetical protein